MYFLQCALIVFTQRGRRDWRAVYRLFIQRFNRCCSHCTNKQNRAVVHLQEETVTSSSTETTPSSVTGKDSPSSASAHQNEANLQTVDMLAAG